LIVFFPQGTQEGEPFSLPKDISTLETLNTKRIFHLLTPFVPAIPVEILLELTFGISFKQKNF